MKFIRLFLFGIMICLHLIVEDVKAKDYIFMIDNSGSMRSTTHDANRQIPDSISQFVELVNTEYPEENERVAIIKFQEKATILLPLTKTDILVKNNTLLQNAFRELNYRGHWTIFKPAFEAFVRTMDPRASETNLILISDGKPDIVNDTKKNYMFIEDDSYESATIIRKSIKPYKNVVFYLFPFSNNYETRFLKRFAYAMSQPDAVKKNLKTGQELFQRLQSRFVFICNSFPPGNVNFNMKILIDDADDIFRNVFNLVKFELPRIYEDINLRNVNMKRSIDYNLTSWESVRTPKEQFELMRKHKVNGLCMIYASDEQSFKYKIIGCKMPPVMGYCKTRRQVGVDRELASQFIVRYHRQEKEMIKSVVKHDEASLTFKVSQQGKKLSAIDNLRSRVVIMDPRNPGKVYTNYNISTERTTNTIGVVTYHKIPRGVPLTFELLPKEVDFDEILAKKFINAGWKKDLTKYNVVIADSPQNYPDDIIILAYAKPNEFSRSIARIGVGNVLARVEYRANEDGDWQHLIDIKDNQPELDKGKLLLGYTYEIKAQLKGFFQTQESQPLSNIPMVEEKPLSKKREERFFRKDDSPDILIEQNNNTHRRQQQTRNEFIAQYDEDSYFKETSILYTTGSTTIIKIPFFLNIPQVVRKNIQENRYMGKEKELFELIKRFLKEPQTKGNQVCAFKLSTDLDVFLMLAEIMRSNKINFSSKEQVQLWGDLLRTTFNCKENNDDIHKNTLTLATAKIVLKLIEQNSDELKKSSYKISAEETIHNIKSRYKTNFYKWEVTADRHISKYITF